MPIMRCQIKGKSGFKWGKSGKCYTGPTGRAKALAQMRAIKANEEDKLQIDVINIPEKNKKDGMLPTIEIKQSEFFRFKLQKELEKRLPKKDAISISEEMKMRYDSLESRQHFKTTLQGLKAVGQLKKPPKRLPKWLPQPRINEMQYWNMIKKIMKPFLNIVNERIRPNLQRWVEENERLTQDGYKFNEIITDCTRIELDGTIIKSEESSGWQYIDAFTDLPMEKQDQIDDWQDEFDDILNDYDIIENDVFVDDQLGLETDLFFTAGIVSAFNKKQFDKIFKSAFGIDSILPETWYQNLSKNWVRENVNLIKGLTDEYRKKFTESIYIGMRQGKTWDQIERELIKINRNIFTGRTETRIIRGRKVRKKIQSRSELIARDQVNKLNGRLTKKRQMDLGIETYTWETVGDAKVRASHAVLNGRTMRWDDDTVYSDDGGVTWLLRADIGGYVGIPGEDFQCRCRAGAAVGIDMILAEFEEF